MEDNTIRSDGTAELTEKRSRFIAEAFHAGSEETVKERAAAAKRKYPDARHVCYAYRLKDGKERAYDNGEPQGTAGMPILDRLRGKDLTDSAVIVTRIFGGVLLGTGGLTRAYGGAAAAALENASTARCIPGRRISVTVDYSYLEKIRYLLSSEKIEEGEPEYSDKVTFLLLVGENKYDKIRNDIMNITSGEAVISDRGAATVYETECS